jgi:hypothetical protein
MNSVFVKFWGAIESFSTDLFHQYPGNKGVPEFARELFHCTRYEGKISQLNSGGVIYRVNTDKNCKAISVISTSTTGTKWGGGREGAFLGCTFFIQSSKKINGVHVVKSLENALSTAIEIIEDNNGKVPRLSDELLTILQDISQEAQSCVSQNLNHKPAKAQNITGEICSIALGEAGESVSKLLNINVQGSIYLIPFIDSQSHFAKKSSPVNALLSRLTPPPPPPPPRPVPPRPVPPQRDFRKSKSKIVIGASAFILLLVGVLYWTFQEPVIIYCDGRPEGVAENTDTIEDQVISGIDDGDTLDVSTGNVGSAVETSVPKKDEEATTNPAADNANPAADDANPAADNANPAADNANPAADNANPAADNANPAADNANPAADNTNPAADAAAAPVRSDQSIKFELRCITLNNDIKSFFKNNTTITITNLSGYLKNGKPETIKNKLQKNKFETTEIEFVWILKTLDLNRKFAVIPAKANHVLQLKQDDVLKPFFKEIQSNLK